MTKKLFQLNILLIGLLVIICLIRFPLLEGRAKGLDLINIYLDPFILYLYLMALVFFIGWFQLLLLLSNLTKSTIDIIRAEKSCKWLKKAAVTEILLIIPAGIYIKLFHAKEDDPTGFLALCFVLIFVSILVYVLTSQYQRKLVKQLEH
ncbi:MAG: DUF2975 domain-containing protein [Bacteroidia bacterium]